MSNSSMSAMTSSLSGLKQAPWLRQVLILVGIAASVAFGVAAVLWSRAPEYRILYSSLAPERASSVVDTLTTLNIPYKLEDQTGAIMVPTERLHDARLKLAGSGLTQGDGSGLEMMKDEKGFGVSEFMETKKYQHALETELARTIESLHQVRRARVHLAIPKQSVFVRERKPASASIFLDVFPGSAIEKQNVTAIVNLVAASIPDLSAEHVTVVDQQGNLLSQLDQNDALAQGSRQFDYRQRIEKTYESRIEQLLSPIVAAGKVRAQVSADIDFSSTQESRESWNPERQVIRSEQISNDQRGNVNAVAAGVPGALSNQPVPATRDAAAPAAPGNAQTPAGQAPAANGSSSVTRNYEIERTLNHSDTPAGAVRRLSVAVVVDSRPQKNAEGQIVKAGPSAAELERLTMLVQNAVGFNADRGDKVTVLSADFRPDDLVTDADAPGFWQEAWFADLVRQGLVGLALLFIVLGVLRPGIRQLVRQPVPALPPTLSGPHGERDLGDEHLSMSPAGLLASTPERAAPLLLGRGLDDRMSMVRAAAADDPRRVAQVVKNWVGDHAEQ